MKYKLIENTKKYDNLSYQILSNRGVTDPKNYLTSKINDYSLLNNINEGAELLLKHIDWKDNIAILIDFDMDGVSSSSMLYNYLKKIFPDIHLSYILHTRKSHGLSNDIYIPDNTNLLIIPDAATNDVEECKKLIEKHIDILIIDHHLQEKENPYAIIINNQCSENYPNKSLSGAGMVYQFLRCLDELSWNDEADNYLDLAALGIIGDSMSMLEPENRQIANLGLSHIKNKAFSALVEKQSYSINGILNPIAISFYIAPLCNSVMRSGTQEENEILIKAFIETDESFPYKKRDGEEIQESIYERMARIATNTKSRQGREVDKSIELMRKKIDQYKWNENKLLFCDGSEIGGNFSGLIAIKLANEYNKPCIFLRENNYEPEYYGGSIRNFDGSPIESLKDFLDSTEMFDYIQGHGNAAGLKIKKFNVRDVISKTNELLKDVSFEKVYAVDFEMLQEYVTIDFIQEIDKMKGLWGQGISEPLILVENIKLNTKDIKLMGKENDTFKFELNDENVVAIKFKCNENDKILEMIKGDWGAKDFEITAVGKVSLSNFNGIITPQFVIVDYNLV